MQYSIDNYYHHIDIESLNLRRNLIMEEAINFLFEPHRIRGIDYPPNEWWSYQTTWQNAIIRNVHSSPHLSGLISKLELIMGDTYMDGYDIIDDKMSIRYYLQQAGSTLKEHGDHVGADIALNIKLHDPSIETAPFSYVDIGDVQYEACLFNTSHRHFVKASSIDRVILRITPIGVSYETFRDNLQKFSILK